MSHEENLGDESADYSEPQVFRVDAGAAGQRLDRVLASRHPDQSRARLQRWIEQGCVRIDDRTVRPSQTLRLDQIVWMQAPEPEPQGDWLAEPMELDIAYEDPDLLVLNKPSGLVVHPAAGHPSGTLLNGLLGHLPGLRELPRAGIVHRLDRDTTGLMVVAKTLESQTELVRQLQARTVSRRYWALCWGALRQATAIDAPIGRDPRDRQRQAVLDTGGKPAITHVKPLAHGALGTKPVTLIECKLETGRTHQIRVHLQHLGFPLVGDPVYQRKAAMSPKAVGFERQALHAFALGLIHPRLRTSLAWAAAAPSDLHALLNGAGISSPGIASGQGPEA
jgi:23S rRNA pseudouridine1911/1915/1917 synthase